MSPEAMWRLATRLHKKRLIWLAQRGKEPKLDLVPQPPCDRGERVKIWQGVTLSVRAPSGSPPRIIIGDGVVIGADAVIITPLGRGLAVGSGAKIGAGAGAVVVGDVPAGATVVGNPARVVRQRPVPEVTRAAPSGRQ